MNPVKLAMLAGTALCLAAGSADAAGMPDSWVGYYVGGNFGYSWGRTDTTTVVSPFIPRGGSVATELNSLKPDGLIGGGQAGFVGRFAPNWLAGVEADLQWSGEKAYGLASFDTGSGTTCRNCSFNNTTGITARLSWFGTYRARAGYEWNGLWLYGTGGLAFGGISVSGINTLTSLVNSVLVGSVLAPYSYSSTEFGWVAGFGVEGLIGNGKWRWKAEYLHLQFYPAGGGLFGPTPVGAVNINGFTDDIVRVGLNYRLTGP